MMERDKNVFCLPRVPHAETGHITALSKLQSKRGYSRRIALEPNCGGNLGLLVLLHT